MKTLKLLLLALTAATAFQACKTTEKTVDKDKEKKVNITVANKDTIPNKGKNTVITSKNELDTIKRISTKSNVEKNFNMGNDIKDTIVEYETIVFPGSDDPPIKGYPIESPLPQIFTDLFPDVTWELIYVNDGLEKMYRASFLGKQYVYSTINEFLQSYYKPGSITDKELVELIIFWFFHPDDSNMKIISTNYFENKVKVYYNYESIIVVNNEQVEVYTLVLQNKIYGLTTYKNGSGYKTPMISH